MVIDIRFEPKEVNGDNITVSEKETISICDVKFKNILLCRFGWDRNDWKNTTTFYWPVIENKGVIT